MVLVRFILAHVLLAGCCVQAQVTNTVIADADAFVCTGSPNYNNGADLTGLNFGAAGNLVVAPPSLAKGEFQSVIRFDLSSCLALFNSAYGSKHWIITSVALKLTSDFGIAGVQPNNPIFPVVSGGQFVIEWLADDSWVEGTGTPSLPTTDGITYHCLPKVLAQPREILCTNTYTPPSNNVPVIYPLPLTANLLADVVSGNEVSFRLYAVDNQIGYLFNSYKYGRGNEPKVLVVAAPCLRITSAVLTNETCALSGIGDTDSMVIVETATSLTVSNWTSIGTATSDASGNILFWDTNTTAASRRLYRFRQ